MSLSNYELFPVKYNFFRLPSLTYYQSIFEVATPLYPSQARNSNYYRYKRSGALKSFRRRASPSARNRLLGIDSSRDRVLEMVSRDTL